jgi:hypothetical protein
MSFTPLRSKSRNLYTWFATRPDLFESERSPRKTTTWAVLAGVMLILALLVYLNPLATVETLGGRIRGGLAIAAAFAMPPVLFVICVVNPVIHTYSSGFPIEQALAAIRTGSADSAGVIAAFTALQKDSGDDRLITIWSSDADRAMYVGLIRVDGNKLWIDTEPFAVDPERYFDAKKHNQAASLGHTTTDGL